MACNNVDLLYGPLYHRLLHGHAPLNDRFTTDVIDMALHGIQPTPDDADAAHHPKNNKSRTRQA